MLVGKVLLIEAKLLIVFFVNGISAHLVGTVEADAGIHARVDGAREDEAAVVVGVFANQVDASGRSVDNAFVSKALLEKRF